MILDNTRSRRAMTRRVLLIALGVGAAALVPLAMLRPVAQAQAGPTVPLMPSESEQNKPDVAVKHLRQIYNYLSVYRRTHGGTFPATLGPDSLGVDIAADPRRYGLTDRGTDNSAQAGQVFDGPGNQRVIYFLHSKRPDGTLTGTAKRAGTRDVFAYTNYYVYNEARGGKTHGFYLVLWDDDTVQKIGVKSALAVPVYDVISDHPGATEQARRQGEKQIAFPGQAGLPRG